MVEILRNENGILVKKEDFYNCNGKSIPRYELEYGEKEINLITEEDHKYILDRVVEEAVQKEKAKIRNEKVSDKPNLSTMTADEIYRALMEDVNHVTVLKVLQQLNRDLKLALGEK